LFGKLLPRLLSLADFGERRYYGQQRLGEGESEGRKVNVFRNRIGNGEGSIPFVNSWILPPVMTSFFASWFGVIFSSLISHTITDNINAQMQAATSLSIRSAGHLSLGAP